MTNSTSITTQHHNHHYAYSSPTKPHVILSENNNNTTVILNSSSSDSFHQQFIRYQSNKPTTKLINPFITTKQPTIVKNQLIKIINESCVPKIISTPKKSSGVFLDYQFIESSPPMTVLKSNNDQFELDKNCLTSDLLFMSGNNSDGSYSRVQQKEVYKNLYQMNNENNNTTSSMENFKNIYEQDCIASCKFIDSLFDASEDDNEIKPNGNSELNPGNNKANNSKCYTNKENELFLHNNDNANESRLTLISSPKKLNEIGTSVRNTGKKKLTLETFKIALKIQPDILAGFDSCNTGNTNNTTFEESTLIELSSSGDSDYSPTATRKRIRSSRMTRNSTERPWFSGLSIPQKLSHGKMPARSRSGCWTCRVRHKACPQEKPSCSQCIRLQLDCDYSETRPDYMCDLELQQRKLREIRVITDKVKKTRFLDRNKSKRK